MILVVEHYGIQCRRVIELENCDDAKITRRRVLTFWAEQFAPGWKGSRVQDFLKMSDHWQPARLCAPKSVAFKSHPPSSRESTPIEKSVSLSEMESLLAGSNSKMTELDWNALIVSTEYPVSAPHPRPLPNMPRLPWAELSSKPIKPDIEDFIASQSKFRLKLKAMMGRADCSKARLAYQRAMASWHASYDEWERSQDRILQIFADRVCYWTHWFEHINEEDEKALSQWNQDKRKWQRERDRHNRYIHSIKYRYQRGDPWGVERYNKLLLHHIPWPALFPQNNHLQYDATERMLVVDLQLPNFLRMPMVKPTKRGMMPIKQSAQIKQASKYCCTVALRALSEIALGDTTDSIGTLALNGWFKHIDPKTGQRRRFYALSVLADKEDAQSIDIANADPYQAMIGLGARVCSDFSEDLDVVPFLKLESARIPVNSTPANGAAILRENLTTIPWERFEELVGLLFRKEFERNAMTVTLTKRSGDGGADAIATDPDPITGGRILIQAKRRKKAVEVEAVRSLYGTLINEGAIKAILVTTSHFGKAAREFVKDKPITLINGRQLQRLLQKHGLGGTLGADA